MLEFSSRVNMPGLDLLGKLRLFRTKPGQEDSALDHPASVTHHREWSRHCLSLSDRQGESEVCVSLCWTDRDTYVLTWPALTNVDGTVCGFSERGPSGWPWSVNRKPTD